MSVVLRAKRKDRPKLTVLPGGGQVTGRVVLVEQEERCEFTELFPSQCAHCLGIEPDWLPKRKVEVYEGSI
jgi:hypothetical protein